MIRRIRQYLAARKLERIVRATRDSFEIQQYRQRRNAALKGRVRA